MADVVCNVIPPTADGSQPAGEGYDHIWFDWEPIPARAGLIWPNGASLAAAVVVNLNAVEWEIDGPGPVPPPGGRGVGVYPDLPRMSHREFGHRVGIFRLLEIAARLGLPLAAAVDVLTAEVYTTLLPHLLPAVEEVIAAGLSGSRPISSLMSDEEETHYVVDSLARLEQALGVRPTGWISPENSQSARTPRVLTESGIRYMMDWSNDEQPYRVPGAGGDLWSFPLSWELSDINSMFIRGVSPEDYAEGLREAVEVMIADGDAGSGRVLGIHLHPWVSGQAFRAGSVEAALADIREDPRIWMATPAQIVDWCSEQG